MIFKIQEICLKKLNKAQLLCNLWQKNATLQKISLKGILNDESNNE